MSDNVQTATFEILKKIQAENADFRRSVEQRFDALERRFDSLEQLVRKNRRDVAGILVIGKSMAGEFNEQLAAVLERVEALEARRS